MPVRRIAGWSGPRNRSTALMRSFEARGDCRVSDEPLYAHYLAHTGLRHPMREAVLASQSQDWRVVTERLAAAVPEAVWYQKHMTHHLLPHVGRDWLHTLRHILWIRDPAAVLASYLRKRPDVVPADLGVRQQHALWAWLQAQGIPAVVVDTDWLLNDPAQRMPLVCEAVGIPFRPAMLSWPAGPRDTDGVWGEHWYESVWQSTGFERPSHHKTKPPDGYQEVLNDLDGPWSALTQVRLR